MVKASKDFVINRLCSNASSKKIFSYVEKQKSSQQGMADAKEAIKKGKADMKDGVARGVHGLSASVGGKRRRRRTRRRRKAAKVVVDADLADALVAAPAAAPADAVK